MSSCLPPIPPRLVAPQIVQLPIIPGNHVDRPSGRVRPSTRRLIGSVVVAWARLENALNDLIWVINGYDIVTGRFETQHLDITKLLSAVQKAVSTKMPGQSQSAERKSITDVVSKINEFKSDRNLVVHGTWAELDGEPSVGSLRADRTHDEFITFEGFDHERLRATEKIAIDACKNVVAMIARLEALRKKPSSQPPKAEPIP